MLGYGLYGWFQVAVSHAFYDSGVILAWKSAPILTATRARVGEAWDSRELVSRGLTQGEVQESVDDFVEWDSARRHHPRVAAIRG